MMVVVMMMMVVMITPECSEGRSDHDAGSPVVVMMVMVMVMVVMVVVLRQLDVAFLRGPALLLIHRLQQRACIRDRL